MASKARMVTLIPVKKMQRAIDFYTKKLDAKVLERAPGEMKNYWASLKVGGAEVWFTVPPKMEKRKLAYQNFMVKNIRSYVALLKRRGVKFQKAEKMGPDTKIDGVISWEPWGGAAFFQDSEGNLLMAWQNIPSM